MTYASFFGNFLSSSGTTDSFEAYVFEDGELYYDGKLLAKKTKLGDVLISEKVTLPTAVNDEFLFALFRNGNKYERVSDFHSLTNPATVRGKISAGEFSSVKRYADLFDVPVDDKDFEVIAAKRTRLDELTAELTREQEEVASRTESIASAFVRFEEERRQRAKAAELAALSGRAKELFIRWDNGDAITSFTGTEMNEIRKANKSERLRIVPRGGTQPREDVQSTTSMRTSLRSLKKSFNLVAPYLWGDKADALRGYNKETWDAGRLLALGYLGNHQMQVSKTIAHMGCQSVSKDELERFATSQGWPLDGTPVAL